MEEHGPEAGFGVRPQTPETVVLGWSGDGLLTIRLRGAWRLKHGMPTAGVVESECARHAPPRQVKFDTAGLGAWDTSLVAFVRRTVEFCARTSIDVDLSGLPPGLKRLVELAEAVPEKKDTRSHEAGTTLLEEIGTEAIGAEQSLVSALAFLGELTLGFVNLARGRARYRGSDLLEMIQQCGVEALGIVTLISYLVGVILAFMGAVQLRQFGASIFVADLVAIAILREMGAMMTGIIMSGRTGAAFAAQLGTMKVTQEIDAFATMGISPIEFLVVPRVLALVLMMPLLCLYSDFVGILGGATVGVGMLKLSITAYAHQTATAMHAHDLLGGLFKSAVYGMLVAFAGCLRGFRCGNSSSAVGAAATAAVVLAIVMIVVACGIFAVIFNILGI